MKCFGFCFRCFVDDGGETEESALMQHSDGPNPEEGIRQLPLYLDPTIKDEFPLNKRGAPIKDILKKYDLKEVRDHNGEKHELYVLDMNEDELGDRGNDPGARTTQQVKIHYDLYDWTGKRIKTTLPLQHGDESKCVPLKLSLCFADYSGGLEAGIIGMRENGIRRIIVPPELINKGKLKVIGYGVFVVQLVKNLGHKWFCVVMKHQSLSPPPRAGSPTPRAESPSVDDGFSESVLGTA